MPGDGLARLNAMPGRDAEHALYSCFANQSWAAAVAATRPFVNLSALMARADSAWATLTPEDWLGAFAAHPRIGESGGHSPRLSEREQRRVVGAPAPTLAALTAENRLYEERFGHVFLIAAHGRSAGEVLEALRLRMQNSPAVELEVAAGEQRKITRLRLEQLCRS
ncbi:MAG: 2-oxo-4-hydroxy-4-carboxy-5-ureidoimidazoline decarboxylase [Candidatus Dormibacterales bacterium]